MAILDNDVSAFAQSVSRCYDLSKVKVILEVAAGDARTTCTWAHLFPQAHVYGFECNPDSLALCKATIASHGLKNLTLVEKAVAEVDGEIEFFPIDRTSSNNVTASSVFRTSGAYDLEFLSSVPTPLKVPSVRVDTWMKQVGLPKIDLLWLDCQGSELAVLKSCGEFLKDVLAVHTEVEFKAIYEGQPLEKDVDAFLKEHGFTFQGYTSYNHWFADSNYMRLPAVT